MVTMLTERRLFLSIHGVDIQFASNSSALVESVSYLLHHFECQPSSRESWMEMTFSAIERRCDVPVEIPSTARQLYNGVGIVKGYTEETTWRCDIYLERGLLVADFHDEGLVVIHGATKSARGWIVRPDSMSLDARASFVHFTVVELAKRCGLFTFHATALEKDGQGVLIPGFSGKGKTTSFLSLLRSGYRYLSDDHPFFRLKGNGVELLPYPLKINVTDRTVSFFPELRNAPSSVLHPGMPKRFFYAEDLYPWPLGKPCEPRVILFPQVINAPHSCLEPLSKKQALEMILPHSLLVYDPGVARSEFQALSRLVALTDCYRLHFGRDVLDLPRLVTPLLQASQRNSEN